MAAEAAGIVAAIVGVVVPAADLASTWTVAQVELDAGTVHIVIADEEAEFGCRVDITSTKVVDDAIAVAADVEVRGPCEINRLACRDYQRARARVWRRRGRRRK